MASEHLNSVERTLGELEWDNLNSARTNKRPPGKICPVTGIQSPPTHSFMTFVRCLHTMMVAMEGRGKY